VEPSSQYTNANERRGSASFPVPDGTAAFQRPLSPHNQPSINELWNVTVDLLTSRIMDRPGGGEKAIVAVRLTARVATTGLVTVRVTCRALLVCSLCRRGLL
jgi:hypothetical protein